MGKGSSARPNALMNASWSRFFSAPRIRLSSKGERTGIFPLALSADIRLLREAGTVNAPPDAESNCS
ncbi:hypothetical protein BN173_230005 [Clostridioides difficile T11]|nr:hypothetical protein BN173_230005 [Clostridioides difficile T11]